MVNNRWLYPSQEAGYKKGKRHDYEYLYKRWSTDPERGYQLYLISRVFWHRKTIFP